MNILFLTEREVNPLKGGTPRVTYTLSKGFSERGHRCFHAYGDSLLSRPSLESAIKDNKVDIVMCNLVDIKYKKAVLPLVREITRETGTRVFTTLHAMPGEEIIGNTLGNSLYRIMKGRNIPEDLKYLLLGIIPGRVLRTLFAKRLSARYRVLYDNSDKVILLSERFLPEFGSLGGLKVDDRLIYIHNSLSFNDFFDENNLGSKKKEVMILSRMDERSKRISRALKVWRNVCLSPGHEDWCLRIVGMGFDLEYYKKMARKLHLKNISFEGWRENEREYYERASIFLMTSAYEGWGLTLTEAQQMGVVPIVFDSYASLKDIIDDGNNGFIVPERDIKLYSEKLLWLMDHEEERHKMAREAIASSHRFSLDNILDCWEALF